MEDLKAVVEMLLFVSDVPIALDKFRDILGDVDRKEILRVLADLRREYEERNGGFQVVEVAGGFQFRTRPDLNHWIMKFRGSRPSSLSPAALETLAIVAYRQPVVKADIDRVRGVDVSGALKGLLEKKLVKMVGRKDLPGKPIMYGTTKRFLEVFGLRDLTELPTLQELKELQEKPRAPQLPGFEMPE